MQQIPRPDRPQGRSVASVALQAWLEASGREQQFLVERLRVSSTLISFYVRGLRVPLGERAAKIERLTGGAVKVQDWRLPAVVAVEEDAAPCADTSPQLAHSSVTPWPSPRQATGKRPRSRVGRRRSPAT